mgnify:CR=1 FL=1
MPGYGRLRQRSRSPNRRFVRRMPLKRPERKAKAKPKPKAKQEKKAPQVKADGSELTPRELSDIKEAEAKAKREANPEATREAKPLQLLVDRASNPKSWIPCIEDVFLRSWMYMSQEKKVTHNDFQELKDKVDWVEIHGAAAVTRKTMWFVKEGCRCPYSYGKQQVSAVTFPDWFLEMAKRWLGCLNLDDQDKDSMFPNCVNLNLYEHGDHQVAWHSDDEPLFRGKFQDTRIISVTLGAMRKFQVGLKAPRRGGILKPEKGSMATFNLGHGQICTMEGLFQKHYLHQIAKGTTRQPRINATFRTIVEHAAGCPLRR